MITRSKTRTYSTMHENIRASHKLGRIPDGKQAFSRDEKSLKLRVRVKTRR